MLCSNDNILKVQLITKTVDIHLFTGSSIKLYFMLITILRYSINYTILQMKTLNLIGSPVFRPQ